MYVPLRDWLLKLVRSCSVGEERVDVAALSCRSMNFGQVWRTPDLPTATYRVRFDRSVCLPFYEAIEPELREWVEAESKLAEPDLSEFVQELARREWPSVPEVVNDDALMLQILEFHDYDLAQSLFSQPDATPGVLWVVNSVDEILLAGDSVTLVGTAGRAELRRAFQDY